MRQSIRGARQRLAVTTFALAIAFAGAAKADTATVASGFTDPPTLTFRSGAISMADNFNGTALDTCIWEQDVGGSYSGGVSGGAFNISGSGSSNTSFTGVLLKSNDLFSPSSYTTQVVISAATANQYRLSLSSNGSNNAGNVEAALGISNDGSYFLDVSFRQDNSTVAQSSGPVFGPTHGNPLPYTLALTVNASAGTVTASFSSAAGNASQTINVNPAFSTFGLRAQVTNMDSGSVSIDSFSSTLTQATKYSISNSPLSVFGNDYSDVPFVNPPGTGVIVITASGDPVLVDADGACVPVDGSASLSSALATFGPNHVTVFTTNSQAQIAGLVQANGGALDCFGSGFVSQGAGNDYTFTAPECDAPSCTDGIKNGSETGIDCGGSCDPCPSPTVTSTSAPSTPTATSAPNTPTTAPTNTVPPTSTNTATAIPTATASVPPTLTATATATLPPAALSIDGAVLSRGRDRSARDNGTVSIDALIDDQAAGGDLGTRVVAGGFSLEVEDGDGSFHVTFPFESCSMLSSGNVICRGDGAVRSTVRLNVVGEGQWRLRARAQGFSNAVTGPTGGATNPTEADVTVTLHEGATETSASISSCRAGGLTKLTCRN